MADSTATFALSLAYTDQWGSSVSAAAQSISVPYQAMASGTLDVPAGTAGSTELTVSLGGIGTAVTGIMLKNNTVQELNIEFNGGTEKPFSIPAGGLVVLAFPSMASETAITALTVTTTAEEVAAASVSYIAFGDSVPA